jgi:glutathione S-transferase
MSKDKTSATGIKLTYFDFPGGRGEECRLAMVIAGVDFDDDRVKGEDWSAIKASTPFGEMPVLEIAGEGVLAQSNAILELIGSRHGLLPANSFEAARHISILNAIESLSMQISCTFAMTDEEKKKARGELTEGYMKSWAENIEKQIKGPFVGGDSISVADIKLFVSLKWVKSGDLDYIPSSYFDAYPKMNALFDAVSNHPKVKEWYSKH